MSNNPHIIFIAFPTKTIYIPIKTVTRFTHNFIFRQVTNQGFRRQLYKSHHVQAPTHLKNLLIPVHQIGYILCLHTLEHSAILVRQTCTPFLLSRQADVGRNEVLYLYHAIFELAFPFPFGLSSPNNIIVSNTIQIKNQLPNASISLDESLQLLTCLYFLIYQCEN